MPLTPHLFITSQAAPVYNNVTDSPTSSNTIDVDTVPPRLPFALVKVPSPPSDTKIIVLVCHSLP